MAPETYKNPNWYYRQTTKSEINSGTDLPDVGTSGCVGTYLATKIMKYVAPFILSSYLI